MASLASTVRPTTRPGILRFSLSLEAKKPSSGPPAQVVMPNGWASPTARSAPYSPGVFRTLRLTGLTAAISSAPFALPASDSACTGSISPR